MSTPEKHSRNSRNDSSPSSSSLQRMSGDQLTSPNSVLVNLNTRNRNSSSSAQRNLVGTSGSEGNFTTGNDNRPCTSTTVDNDNINANVVEPQPLQQLPPTPTRTDHGASSGMNPRAKRPSKPGKSATASSAILEAKRNAQAQAVARRVTRNSNPNKEPANVPQQKQPEPDIIVMKDHLQPARDMKGVTRQRTGVVYDLQMQEHYCLWDQNYPEKPERFTGVINRCQELGLIERCLPIRPRLATEDEIRLLHTDEHIAKLKSICDEDSMDKMEEFASNYDAVYIHPTTYNLSCLSVGSTIELVNAVLDRKVHNGMAIIRPPGHHAMKSEYCGYCYFNNVAIAAKKALDEGKASKILIVDFDVHHGQATQQMFYDDKRVLYFSTHRYEHGNFWPNLEESNYNFIGCSDGIGFNCNVPLNKTKLGNADFLTVWHQLLLPLAYEFNPDLVIVSAGFDCVYGCFEFDPDLVMVSAGYDSLMGDEKGEMELTPQCCPHLLWPLLGLAEGKVAVILEGGYCIKSLSEGAALTLRALLGDPCPSIPKISTPDPILVDSLLNCTYMLKPYWQMLAKQQVVSQEMLSSIRSQGLLHMPEIKYEWKEPKPSKYATRDCYPIQNTELINTINERLDSLMLSTNLARAEHKVGIAYDDLMLKHRNLLEPYHPETPERISNIFANHADYGLLERCIRLQSRDSTEEELLLVHSQDHVDLMKRTHSMKKGELDKLQSSYNSIFLNNASYKAALISAGCVLEAVDSVLNGKCQSGIAIVRPPGHHAEEDIPHGFCIFNNVAVAAKHAVVNHGLSRVLIVDWDVHHGNGIQHMFEDDPRVLYISIHRYDHGTFFPCKEDANYNVVGKGSGKGFTVNIPWNSSKMGDTEYLAVFTNVILPIAYEYNPELVLVSAGFDAAKGDPLGGCNVTPEGYGHMTHLLSSLANGKVILALEGGYNLTSIAYSMVMCTRALLGDPLPKLTLNKKIHPGALNSIQDVLDVHAEFWTVLKPFRKYLPNQRRLISLGSYYNLEDAMDSLELKNNNVNANELQASHPQLSSSTVSESSLSPANNSRSVESLSPPQQSPEAITMTLLIDNDDSFSMGACGGGTAPSTSSSFSGGNSQHKVVLSNFDEAEPAAVYPSPWCPHVEQVQRVPNGRIDTSAPCEDCGHSGDKDNWICLVCYRVLCSRYVNKHMEQHSSAEGHQVAMSFGDLSVWCYACNTYLHNPKFMEAFRAAHLDKFGEEPPSSSS